MGTTSGASSRSLTCLETAVPAAAAGATQRVSNTFSGYCTSYSMAPHCLSYCVRLGPAVPCDPWLIQRLQRSRDSRHRGPGQFYSSTIGTVVALWLCVFLERYGGGLCGSQPNLSCILLLLIAVVTVIRAPHVEGVKRHNGMQPACWRQPL